MKLNLQNNDEFDEFFKKKYDTDTIEPSQELWGMIHQKIKFANISVNYHSILKLRIMVAIMAAALIGTIIYFQTSINKTKKEDIISTNIEKTNIPLRTDSMNIVLFQDIEIVDENHINLENENTDEIEINSKKQIMPSKSFPLILEDAVADHLLNLKTDDEQYSGYKDKPTKNDIVSENIIKINNKSINKQVTSSFSDSLTTNEIFSENNKSIEDNKHLVKYNTIKDKLLTSSDTEDEIYDLTLSNSENIISNKLNMNSENKRFKDKLSLSIYVVPKYSFRTMVNNYAYSRPELDKTYFNDHEKGGFSFSTGVQLFYELTTKWKLSIGVEYAQYSQKMKLGNFDIKIDGQNGYYSYSSIGKDNLIIHSSIPISNKNFIESSKTYSFINIPLDIEYKLSENFFIVGGISYNLLVATNVNWQAEDYNGDFTITTNNITGIRKSNFSFSLGVGYEKSISSKFSLALNPMFTTFIMSFTKKMPVKTYPYSVGLKLGVRYKL